MRLILTQTLEATPEAVWPLVTEPRHMNRWFKARVRLRSSGDGGGAGAVGAIRRVTFRAGALPLPVDQVISVADPPRRLVYHVFSGPLVRRHRGELTLRPTPTGTLLRWRLDLHAHLVADGLAVRLFLEPLIRDSLARLVELVRHAPSSAWSAPDAAADADSLPELYAAAEAVLAEQDALAAELTAARDPRRWFARLYSFSTESQIERCRAGRFQHPAWVLRLVVRFHHYYVENLRRWRGDVEGEVEPHWRLAFEAAEHPPDPLARVAGGALMGLPESVRAHVDGDLPRALAEVYVEHYAHRYAFNRLRADYLLMAEIFPSIRDRLSRHMPALARLVSRAMPTEVKDGLGAWMYYDVVRHRRRAFERGEQLAALKLLLGPYAAERHVATILPVLAPTGCADGFVSPLAATPER